MLSVAEPLQYSWTQHTHTISVANFGPPGPIFTPDQNFRDRTDFQYIYMIQSLQLTSCPKTHTFGTSLNTLVSLASLYLAVQVVCTDRNEVGTK